MLPVLRSRAMLLEPAVRIGKNGLTPAVIREIDALLDKRKLVKIKLLKSSMETAEKQQLITAAAKETGALLVQSAGMTFALYREAPGPRPK
ncbi:TPA: YhbY family RNA-binding protein [Candidatus Woesearchaeota archaeon]|nr:YhbY family RNA-binding protein [Candidatus Woesearchaeota archaeon]HIH05265.1 YhbY family RNA-binding protein [Candidatus Woesearchaeota archaeon]HIH92309.1 YhbY family RNA-binding protein [Candidatus Woesearchaeota archaeon]HII64410.1 YhbY family RNA-binding protein [Candidatus Woesearchaeota archaeon]HII66278.1 YhbY family RNA-binding protein [Candidatus Woesearchaeota archaeon]